MSKLDTENSLSTTENSVEITENQENSGIFPTNTQNNVENSVSAKEVAENSENKPENVEISDKSTNGTESQAGAEENSQNIDKFSKLFSEDSIKAFKGEFPALNHKEVLLDRSFLKFTSLLKGEMNLSKAYSIYLDLASSLEKSFLEKSIHKIASDSVKTTSLSSSGTTSEPFFTKEQVLRMSKEQIKRNYKAIRKSQERW